MITWGWQTNRPRILKPAGRLPTLRAMTVGSMQPAGGAVPALASRHPFDPESEMVADMVAFRTRDTPSVGHLLDVVDQHLRTGVGLSSAAVFALDAEAGTLRPIAAVGQPAEDDLSFAGRVFRMAAGAPPIHMGNRMAVRLRTGGQTVGVLVLAGSRLGTLLPATIATTALHLASTLEALAAEGQRQFISHSSATVRRLFEEGTGATSVEDAGEVLARAISEAFRTERAGLSLTDPDGRIAHVVGVGLSTELGEHLRSSLVGKLAEPPDWQTAADGRPIMVGDVLSSGVRAGALVETMGLKSFIGIPLQSASGAVGMVVCGDASATREWTGRDRDLAQHIAAEGALIVDSARLRQAERQHVAQLTYQAFSDALTGLPNRPHLMRRADEAIAHANATGERIALLLLDLDGFKKVNDTVGHHAGDQLLQAVGKRLPGTVRGDDLVARLGGDEFAILLCHDPDEQRATMIAERIFDRLCEPYEIDGRPLVIGASVGVAVFPDDAADIESLMRAADAAMYRAKRRGGGVRLARH